MHFKEAKLILSPKNGINIYRGCTHGCIYCDSRSVCYKMEHEFEDVEVKINAPKLLEEALAKKRKKCMIGTGAMSDPYIPAEEKLELTKKCLEIIERYGFGVSLLTKSDMVLRDVELLKRINSKAKAVVSMTLTTADDELCRIIEPGVCVTSKRVEALKTLQSEGISTIVWLCPLLPYINCTEENIRALVKSCADAKVFGILYYGAGLSLREGNREYYYSRLDKHFPGLREVYEKKYGNAYSVFDANSSNLSKVFYDECKKAGIVTDRKKLFSYTENIEDASERKSYQTTLF